MKKLMLITGAMALVLSVTAQTNWNVDRNHSKISFVVTHMMVNDVEGEFRDFDAKVASAAEDFNGADVEFTAKVASISTENDQRDTHLKSNDFFDAEKYPTIAFKGKLVKEGGKYYLKGDFTMRDVTKPVTFDVTYGGTINTGMGTRAGFRVNGIVNRTDYGVSWNRALEAGGLTLSDDVQIICRVELIKA